MSLQEVIHLTEAGKPDEALKVCSRMLNENPDDPAVLYSSGRIFLEAERTGMAYAFLKRAVEIAPFKGAVWNALGRCYQELGKYDEAEHAFRKAVKIDDKDFHPLVNLGLLYLNRCDPERAIDFSNKALAINPKDTDALLNRGISYLQQGRWKEGWEGYATNLGLMKVRKERIYGEETRWQGEKNKVVVCYGEQGIGDEVSFGSCIPDLIRDSKKVIIETEKRLVGLFKRSFPEADVYGTRYENEISWCFDYQIDHRVPLGGLPQFYRQKNEDFPGTAYLKADPERVIQWKALLDSLGPEPKIGITWTGGLNHTGRKRRSFDLETLLPLLKQKAHFISLQYKDAPEVEEFEKKHGIKVHHWKRAVQTDDYDDTAALVESLDLVVSVTTAVIHLAGGLGKPCWVMTPKHPMWRYCPPEYLWAKSVKLYRQKDSWSNLVQHIAGDFWTQRESSPKK